MIGAHGEAEQGSDNRVLRLECRPTDRRRQTTQAHDSGECDSGQAPQMTISPNHVPSDESFRFVDFQRDGSDVVKAIGGRRLAE